MEKCYRREELLTLNKMPTDRVINLTYSRHSLCRKEDRHVGTLDVLPTVVRCSEKNIDSAYYIEEKLKKIVVRLDYSKTKWLYLVIVDGFFVKTLWWRDKIKKHVRLIRHNS